MFIEKRKVGSGTKYYLVHSYRDALGKSRKLRKFLGSNLTEQELKEKRKKAERELKKEIKEITTEVFFFTLSERERTKINAFSEKIRVHHLDERAWRQFTETFVYNTNAIEGSQLLEEEIRDVLQSPHHNNADELEAKGVQKAIEFIRETQMDFSIKLLLRLHTLCFDKTKPFAGKLRDVEVVIRDAQGNIVHQGVPVKELQEALKDLVSWYKENEKQFTPLALAAIMHNQFEHIHPFQDGNGRVGRLLLNYVLLKHNYPPINIAVEDRQEYYRTLREYDTSQDLLLTMKFLIKQYKKTIKQVITKNTK